MEEENDQLAQQGTTPPEKKEGLQQSHQSGDEIISGARNEDQLDKIEEAAPEGGRASYPGRQAGATPND